jgi:hypothetical protein
MKCENSLGREDGIFQQRNTLQETFDRFQFLQYRFDGGDRVLGVVAPVAPVRSHDDVFGAGVVDFGDDRRSAVSGNRFGLRAGPEQGKAGEKDQQFFHF